MTRKSAKSMDQTSSRTLDAVGVPGKPRGPLIDSCGRVVGINTYIVTSRQTTKANYALGGAWLAAFLRGAKTPFDLRADSCA